MIERHYWRWIEADGREGVRLESTLLGAADPAPIGRITAGSADAEVDSSVESRTSLVRAGLSFVDGVQQEGKVNRTKAKAA